MGRLRRRRQFTVNSPQSKAPLSTLDYRLSTRAAGPPDLRRLRLKGLILRLPGTYRYVVTPAGRRIALFFSKTFARVLRPGLARLDAPAPIDPPDPLVTAWRRLDQAIDHLVHDARLAA